jgi:hypothetical protein
VLALQEQWKREAAKAQEKLKQELQKQQADQLELVIAKLEEDSFHQMQQIGIFSYVTISD